MKGRCACLQVSLVTDILASMVIGVFDGITEQLVALAVLTSIVASMGGNEGTRTVAVEVRAVVLRQLASVSTGNFISHEVQFALLNGLVFSGLVSCFGLAILKLQWLWLLPCLQTCL